MPSKEILFSEIPEGPGKLARDRRYCLGIATAAVEAATKKYGVNVSRSDLTRFELMQGDLKNEQRGAVEWALGFEEGVLGRDDIAREVYLGRIHQAKTIASLAEETGLSRRAVELIESGKRRPLNETRRLLSNALGFGLPLQITSEN